MEGNGEADKLAACGVANPAAHQGVEQRREDGDVPVSPDEIAEAVSGGRKRKRDDEEPEAEGSQQAAQRLSATPVQQPAVAPAPLPLQRLLDACRAALGVASAPPMASIVPHIRSIMDTIGPDDVGLWDEINFFNEMNAHRRQNPPIITCKTIHQCDNFTIAVFFVPSRSVMPLHDHPGMTVFSKLLIGSARLEAYDWVRPRILSTMGPHMLAEKVQDRKITSASGTWVLFPDGGGNLHRFTPTVEERYCAFLDVLTPPYAPAEQRICTYYQESSDERSVARGGRMGRLVWLKEVPAPRDLVIVNLQFQDS